MNTLLVLYLIYLSWGTAGQGRVSILEMARYLRISKTNCRKRMFGLADDNMVEVIETFSDAGSKKLYVSLSEHGTNFLMENFDASQAAYHLHVAETILAIKAKYNDSEYTPRKLSKRERDALAAGQKEIFSEG